MIIILEGPDGVGKTTLANTFKEIYKKKVYYMHLRVHKNMKLWHTASARLAIRKHNGGRLVMMDRHWPSEQWYSYIFREGPSYDPTDLYYDLKEISTKYIWCLPSDLRKVKENHIKNRERRREEYHDIDKVIDLYHAHWYGITTGKRDFLGFLSPLMNRPDFIRYDMFTHGKDKEKWIKEILI